MKKLLLVPALLLAACGDNLHPDEDQVAAGAAGGDADAPADASELTAMLRTSPASCFNGAVNFEGAARYADGTVVTNPICHYDFGDGTFADTCSARHAFAMAPGNVLLTVADPATGATAVTGDAVVPPAHFDAVLITSTDGLSISWQARGIYDGADGGSIDISIEPADKVIVDDPFILTQGVGTVRVTEAGTYVVKLHTAFFPGVEGCERDAESEVEVVCAGSPH